MEKYDHIQIERQEIVAPYRGHSNPNAPRPPVRARTQHGQKLQTELMQASEAILRTRRDAGIETDNLMVLEISSEALSGDILELLISKFKLSLVEETLVPNTDRSKLVVQFENQDALNEFNAERALWEVGIHEDAILTYAKRRDLFCCVDAVRSMTREDRIGIRLKSFVEQITEDTGFFIVNIGNSFKY